MSAGRSSRSAGAWCAATPFDEVAGHGFIDSQRKGFEVFADIAAGRAAAGRRRGVAVQPPRARRAAHAPRPDHGRGQLERHVPGPGRPAEPDGEPDQGRGRVLVVVECRLHRRVGARRAADVAGDGHGWTTTSATSTTCRRSTRRSPRWRSVGRWPISCGGTRRSSACSTRAAWGCTTRSSTTSCSTRWGSTRSGCRRARLVAEMNRVSDDEAAAVEGLARRRRAALRLRHRRGERADRGAGDQPVEDVHRGAAHRRRLRARRRRHPVPAGAQGRRAGERPGRRAAQQRRAPAGARAATGPASCTPASRCRTSTRSTRVSPSMRW